MARGARMLRTALGPAIAGFLEEGFSDFDTASMLRFICQELGLPVAAIHGGPDEMVTGYMWQNHIPQNFTEKDAEVLLAVIRNIAENNGLIE